MARRGDFTEQARSYAAARPAYPDALVDRLIAKVGVGTDDAVADLGAGTGLFTRSLELRGFTNVRAIEPNAAMRAQAIAHEGVSWSAGTFEDTGLGDASQRWIIAAHAFHWADPGRALPELHRALDARGALSVLFNVRDEAKSEVLAFTRARIEVRASGFDEGYRDRDWAEILTHTRHFARAHEDAEPHVVPMSAERFVELWRSHHLLARAIGADGIEELCAELERYLGGRAIEVPYVCRSWTVWKT
jgi:trans-aconitate methyltransferase